MILYYNNGMDKKELTYDYIAGTDIHLWQRKDMFRINTDTAQLARFMKIRKGERVLDVGTNNGALLLAAAADEPSFLCGVDIQEEACELAESFGIPNLLLYHTEETHGKERKKLYVEEGRQYYHGNLYVPDDLELFEL